MPIAKVQIRIPWSYSNLGSTYSSTNVLSFDSAAVPITQGSTNDLLAAVIDCYESLDGLYGAIAGGNIAATLYDMSVATPPNREPVNEAFGTFTPGAGTVPPECTMLVTFKATPAALVSRRRRRGRVNIGPMDTATLTNQGAFTTAAIDQAADAFEALNTAVNGLPDWDWVCGSEANGYFPPAEILVSSEAATLTSRQGISSGGVAQRSL